jgi:hypothetical protein
MGESFDLEREKTEANKFKLLAAVFDRPGTVRICERLKMLAALCEEKVKIFAELLDETISAETIPQTKLLEWPDTIELPIKKQARTGLINRVEPI